MAGARGYCKVFTVSLVPATVLCLAIAFFAGFILLPTLYTELSYREQYALVIDAGSSHSEVYLYNWKLPFYDNTGLVRQKTYCRAEGAGISDYDNSSAAANSLYNCISGVVRLVPKHYNHKVKVWLGATAGMRLLKHENESLANDTINAINDKYNNEEIKSKRLHMNAMILSGEEEGLSGWITTNYVNGSFKHKYPGDERDLSTTNGALDMGGASMQISYSVINDTTSTRSVSLFGNSYDLYVRSYLCYGINEASRRILAFAVKSANYNSTVEVPCYHTGYVIQTDSSYLFDDHYCTSQLGPVDNNFKNFTITGSSNASMCWALIRSAMNFSVNITSGESIGYTPPNPYGVFYGFSNFYYTSDAFDVSELSPGLVDSFYANVSRRCNMSWDEVEFIDDSYYRAFRCIDGMFMLHALDGMGFSNKSTNQWTIYFKYQVNDIFIGWSLGYMLDKSSSFTSSYYYTHYPYTVVDLIVGMIVLLVLCLIFAIFFAFTCSACSKSLRPTKSGYTNIT